MEGDVFMANITMTLDDELIKKVKKIAVEKNTTLTGLVRNYLKQTARREEQRTEEIVAELYRTMNDNSFHIGSAEWTREELHER